MDVRTFAQQRGVSERRVRALIANGAIHATKHGRAWAIDDSTAQASAPGRRPLSAESRSALAVAIHTRSIASLHGQTRARTAGRLRALRTAPHPASLLSDWWGGEKPTIVDAATSMVARAIAGDEHSIRIQLARNPTRYLRRPEDLAATVLTERTVLGLSRQSLTEAANLESGELRHIEASTPTSIAAIRRVLRALDIEPTALPTPQVGQ